MPVYLLNKLACSRHHVSSLSSPLLKIIHTSKGEHRSPWKPVKSSQLLQRGYHHSHTRSTWLRSHASPLFDFLHRDPENEGKKKSPRERKGAYLNEAFRAHGGSLSCGYFPNHEGKLQSASHFYPELVQLIINSTDRTSRDYVRRQRTARDCLRDLQVKTQELWATLTLENEQI